MTADGSSTGAGEAARPAAAAARPRARVVLCCVAVGAVAAPLAIGRTSAPAAALPVAVNGTVVLEVTSARAPAGGRSEPAADVVLSGPVRLDAGELHLDGTLEARGGRAVLTTEAGAAVQQVRGTLVAQLGGASCSGAFAWSVASSPAASAGTLSLSCDDGALLAGTLLVGDHERGRRQVVVDLASGTYTAGS